MATEAFIVRSPAFTEGAMIPTRYTCDGEDVSPPLDWGYAPPGTRSYALIVDDLDAPSGIFTHWLLFDLPAESDGLIENVQELGTEGRNDFQKKGYGGPCPPTKDGDHRYRFRLLALDVDELDVSKGTDRASLEVAMRDHVLDEAVLMGRYARG